jgi:hypothetical protein
MVLSHRNELSSGILNVIAEETNVQRVQWFLAHTPEGLLPGVELSVTLGKELIEEYDETKLSVALDTEMTNELKEEGAARELVRSIQNLRKAAGMSLSDTATVSVPTMPSAEWQQWVEQKTNSKLEIGSEFKLNS